MHGEDDLPADFRKKLTEWEIRKALVGKSQQNVEELQKNLGEEFNRKMAEWERIKASASHGHIKAAASHLQVKPSSSVSCIQAKPTPPPSQVAHKSGSIPVQCQIKGSASTSHVLAKGSISGPSASPRLDRKGSGHKIKKSKSHKTDKAPVVSQEAVLALSLLAYFTLILTNIRNKVTKVVLLITHVYRIEIIFRPVILYICETGIHPHVHKTN